MSVPNPELSSIVDFLGSINPLNSLSEQDLWWAAKHTKITYHRQGAQEEILDLENPTLFIVRAGAFDVRDHQGELLDRVERGGFFGFVSLLTGGHNGHTLSVAEDGLLYRLDKKVFRQLRQRSEPFDQFFNNAFEQRLRVGLRARNENSAWATRIEDMMTPNFHSVPPTTSILATTQTMRDHNIASIGITGHRGELLGIFTDRDCRSRVIAEGVDSLSEIQTVMSVKPITIDASSHVHEAMLLMSRHRVKHLPVAHNQQIVGIVTLSDLTRLQRSDPVLLINNIHRANSAEELIQESHLIPELLRHLIRIDVRADDLGRILTSVTSALTRRLIKLAQLKLGPEPIPFVWLAFGSQGRQDQSAKSDQDNGLLLSDQFDTSHDRYFNALAEYVNAGLDACGYIYCPGDIMAQNPQWRQPLKVWRSQFKNWIEQPTAHALMHASIFFDPRPIYTSDGADGLFQQLQDTIKSAADNSIFLGLLTKNALELSPPLGFFSQLITDGKDDRANTFDIKLRGIMPINDIARIHALANKIEPVNTRDRLQHLIDDNIINQRDGHNLLDAQEFIAHQRLLHQGQQLSHGQLADNHLNPSHFSSLTVRQLKDAFKVVRDAQLGLKLKYASAWG